MNELPSAQFRKVYAKLRETTIVTANGHAIGRYTPIVAAIDPIIVPASDLPGRLVVSVTPGQRPFAEFRPVPKPGKRA